MTSVCAKPSISLGKEPQGLAGTADGDDSKPARARFVDHAIPALAVHIDHGGGALRQQLAEQAQLLAEVILEGRVIIQVIAGDIGEGAGGERHAVDAALLQAMTGGFEREMGDAVARHGRKKGV